MEVRTYRHAAAAVLLVALVGCDGDDGGNGVGTLPGGGSGSNLANALADLDRLIVDADAYLFVGSLVREDGALATIGEPLDEPLTTDLFAGFGRVTDGDTAALLADARSSLVEQITVGCRINGSYDGVDFDDLPDEEDADGEFGEDVLAGEALPVSDETRALGALRVVRENTGDMPYYRWDQPDDLDRTTVGTLNVEVPGDVFPGLGTLTLPEAPLAGVTADGPLTVESTVRWEPAGDGGTILVALEVDGVTADEDGDRDGLYIECITADDGEFRLPDATLARLPESVDVASYYGVERLRADIVPMGEAIVFLTRFTSRTLFGND